MNYTAAICRARRIVVPCVTIGNISTIDNIWLRLIILILYYKFSWSTELRCSLADPSCGTASTHGTSDKTTIIIYLRVSPASDVIFTRERWYDLLQFIDHIFVKSLSMDVLQTNFRAQPNVRFYYVTCLYCVVVLVSWSTMLLTFLRFFASESPQLFLAELFWTSFCFFDGKQQQQSLFRNSMQMIDIRSINIIPPKIAINVSWRGNGPTIAMY